MLPTLDESLKYELGTLEVDSTGEPIKWISLSIEHSDASPGYWNYQVIDSVGPWMIVSSRPMAFDGICKYIIPRYGLSEATSLVMHYKKDVLDDSLEREKVYVLNQEGTSHYKIGRSNNVWNRMASLQCGNPGRLVVVHLIPSEDAVKLEGALHKRFQSQRLEGEWFWLSEKDVNTIKEESK